MEHNNGCLFTATRLRAALWQVPESDHLVWKASTPLLFLFLAQYSVGRQCFADHVTNYRSTAFCYDSSAETAVMGSTTIYFAVNQPCEKAVSPNFFAKPERFCQVDLYHRFPRLRALASLPTLSPPVTSLTPTGRNQRVTLKRPCTTTSAVKDSTTPTPETKSQNTNFTVDCLNFTHVLRFNFKLFLLFQVWTRWKRREVT